MAVDSSINLEEVIMKKATLTWALVFVDRVTAKSL
jgi:hypothetical protein